MRRSAGAAAPPASPGLALHGFLPYRLSVLSEIVSRAFARHYQQRFGIGIAEWRVMAVLGEDPAQSTQDVIERTQMDRVRVSRAVIRLADKGLLTRAPRPGDKRAQVLSLSRQGAVAYQAIVPLAQRLQHALARSLTREEAAALDHLLAKLQAGAIALEGEAP